MPLRPIQTPTRSRRLNEILGLMLLVGATLLLLALVSYTPSDPSLDTVGGGAAGAGGARNWTGVAGAYVSDALLQTIGIAAFLLPLLLIRVGVLWMRSRASGSPLAKGVGLALWLVFAPAAISLLPAMEWKHTLPLSGLCGRLVADAMVRLLNVPGTAIVVTLMVALSLYLSTTFMFSTARDWASTRFSFLGWFGALWQRMRRREAEVPAEMLDAGGSGGQAVARGGGAGGCG